MESGRDWWGIAWRAGVLAFFAVVGVGVVLVFFRGSEDFTLSFQGQLKDAGYPTAMITKDSTSLGGGRSQPLYIARVTVGTCMLRLDRVQFHDEFRLVEVGGRPVDDPNVSPGKEQALTFLGNAGVTC